jgi:2-polyprenyl-3-methyl-5-hydroxy-6-metoxy-1,4-benzoquinol methylase
MSSYLKTCPLCAGEELELFDKIFFRGLMVINHICERCGFVFQSPRQTEEELNSFYAAEYRQIYQGNEGPTHKDLLIQEHRAAFLVNFTKEYLKNIDRHLDIGCSTGILLKTFQHNFNSKPVGIEPGNTYRNYAQAKGIDVFRDIADVRSSGEKSFDLVSMAHVLEHIHDPVPYLIDLRRHHITPGGYLLVEVPNLYTHDSFEIAHMSAFSKHTLTETLKKSGYSVIAVKRHGKPRSNLLPLYLTMLAKVEKENQEYTINPENAVRLKRSLGYLRRRILQKLFPQSAWVQY